MLLTATRPEIALPASTTSTPAVDLELGGAKTTRTNVGDRMVGILTASLPWQIGSATRRSRFGVAP